MIAALRGTIAEKLDGACVVDCAGVGYLVHVSSHTLAALPGEGGDVRLRTRQIVREDAVQLFGFADADEARLFDLLIGVNGVGPKLALAALSGLQPASLARAIRDEQVAAIVAVPGIGRKTAERLIVELRDKVEFLAAGAPPSRPGPKRAAAKPTGPVADATNALLNLGFTPAQVQETLRAIGEDAPDLPVEDLVRRALSRLGRAAALTR